MANGNVMLRFDTDFCYQDNLGAPAITTEDLAGIRGAAKQAHENLVARSRHGLDAEFASLNLPEPMLAQLPEIEAMAAELRKYRDIFIVGIGGSSLGSKAVRHALKPDKEKRLPQHLHFIENIDPYQLEDLLLRLHPETSAVICISKSGGTIETVVQYLVLRQWLTTRLGDAAARQRQWLITDPDTGWLRELAGRENLPTLAVPPKVGGRYSVLSPVGLLPLAVAGVDIRTLLQGADDNARRCQSAQLEENPALEAAVLYYLLDIRYQKRISIMMPYVNRLRLFVDWYCQLWAESLGKNTESAPAGTLPVRAMGAVDQHSQLQMYLESRPDKMFTFISLDTWTHDLPIPLSENDRSHFPYLAGKSLAQVIQAEFSATRQVITDAGHPNLTIHAPTLDAHALGQLIDFYQRTTIYTGLLYGINPLDQPAVEKGKKLAIAQLSQDAK